MVVWALWLAAIVKGSRAGMVGGVLLLGGFIAAIVVVNGERGEAQHEDYRAAIERYISEVTTVQAQALDETGGYTEAIPELPDEILVYSGGLFQDEEPIDTSVTASKRGYEVSGQIAGEMYKLTVERSAAGKSVESRSCEAEESAGCVDGQW